MKTGPKGLALIKAFEGLRTNAYRCPAGVWTIGYGHTGAAGSPRVAAGMRITPEEAEAILVRDLARYERAVADAVRVPLRQDEFDALVSLCFNIGPGAFAKSTLVRRLNAGNAEAVPGEFARWVKAGGRTLPGLVRRRAAEAALWAQAASPAPAKPAPLPDGPQPEPPASEPATAARTGARVALGIIAALAAAVAAAFGLK